jgi:hypothetical protein
VRRTYNLLVKVIGCHTGSVNHEMSKKVWFHWELHLRRALGGDVGSGFGLLGVLFYSMRRGNRECGVDVLRLLGSALLCL